MSLAHPDQTNPNLIGLLDIGSTKIACAVVEVVQGPSGARRAGRVLGLGHQRSKGITSGLITNLDEAEAAVRSAVSNAERMAGSLIGSVVATVSCGRIASQRFKAHVEPAASVVDADDTARLRHAADGYARRGGRLLIHLNLMDYAIDDQAGIDDPIGFGGDRLTGTFHTVSGDAGPIRNLGALISRCYLANETLVPAPVASALSVTSSEERQLGCTVVDYGGGTISFADYEAGRLSGCGVLAFGGDLITYDIARRFGTTVREAERIKTLYGTMVSAPSDDSRVIEYARPDDAKGDGRLQTQQDLNRIVTMRVERQLAAFAESPSGATLVHAGPGETRPVILTGGASLLTAVGGPLAATLKRPVRLAAPRGLPGLGADLASPQFAALWGLSHCVPRSANARGGGTGVGSSLSDRLRAASPRNEDRYADRVQQWVRDAF